MSEPHTAWLLRLFKPKETLLVGTPKGVFEEAQQNTELAVATPKITSTITDHPIARVAKTNRSVP